MRIISFREKAITVKQIMEAIYKDFLSVQSLIERYVLLIENIMKKREEFN